MIPCALRRFVSILPTLVIVTLIVFALAKLRPGDPARLLLGEEATPQTIVELRRTLGLDLPAPVQYLNWLVDVVRFDLGTSLRDNSSVTSLILEKLPATIELAVLSMLLALAIALPVGILSALNLAASLTGSRPGSVSQGSVCPASVPA